MPVAPKKVFVSEKLSDIYNSLDSKHKHRKWIDMMREALSENMLIGEKIRKNRIPKEYSRKYGLTNLYRYSHPEGYRSLYTIEFFDDDGLCPVILDFLSHKKYEKVFDFHGLF